VTTVPTALLRVVLSKPIRALTGYQQHVQFGAGKRRRPSVKVTADRFGPLSSVDAVVLHTHVVLHAHAASTPSLNGGITVRSDRERIAF